MVYGMKMQVHLLSSPHPGTDMKTIRISASWAEKQTFRNWYTAFKALVWATEDECPGSCCFERVEQVVWLIQAVQLPPLCLSHSFCMHLAFSVQRIPLYLTKSQLGAQNLLFPNIIKQYFFKGAVNSVASLEGDIIITFFAPGEESCGGSFCEWYLLIC